MLRKKISDKYTMRMIQTIELEKPDTLSVGIKHLSKKLKVVTEKYVDYMSNKYFKGFADRYGVGSRSVDLLFLNKKHYQDEYNKYCYSVASILRLSKMKRINKLADYLNDNRYREYTNKILRIFIRKSEFLNNLYLYSIQKYKKVEDIINIFSQDYLIERIHNTYYSEGYQHMNEKVFLKKVLEWVKPDYLDWLEIMRGWDDL